MAKLPARIRVNATFPFPSLVNADGPVQISKASGIWTIGLDPAFVAGGGANPHLIVGSTHIDGGAANNFLFDNGGILGEVPAGAVIPGSYTNTNLTVTAQGVITAIANGASGGGVANRFDTLTAMVAAHIPAAAVAQTDGYAAPGDGGGALYKRKTVQSADPDANRGFPRSADGAYWQYVPDNRGVNCKAFGAVSDATDSGGTVGGTDNTSMIQDAIDYAMRSSVKTCYLPGGNYRVNHCLHLGWGDTFYSTNFEGDHGAPFASGFAGLSGTSILFDSSTEQCLNVAGGRANFISGINFYYPRNWWWVFNNVWNKHNAATVTTPIASPGVVNEANHGLSKTIPIVFNVGPGSVLPTEIVDGNTYYALSTGANTYNIALTPNGSPLNFTGANTGSHTRSSYPPWVLPRTPAGWVDPGLTQGLAQHAPIAAITTDAFAGPQPTPHYPSYAFPIWTGLSGHDFYNTPGYCSVLTIRNCFFQGWPVAVVQGLVTGNQGDFTTIQDCFAGLGAYGFSINNNQSRNVQFQNVNGQFLWTMIDNLSFGSLGGGVLDGPITNISMSECYSIFNMGGASGIEISYCYCEGGLRRWGTWSSPSRLTLKNWHVSFDDSVHGMERALVEANNGEVYFEGCNIGASQFGICHLVYAPSGGGVITTLGAGNNLIGGAYFTDTSVVGHQAASYGGGYIMNGGLLNSKNQNRVAGASSATILTPGGASPSPWSDIQGSFWGEAPVAYSAMLREGQRSFTDVYARQWDITQTAPISSAKTTSGVLQESGAGLSAFSRTAGTNIWHFTYTLAASFENTYGYNHWGFSVGDILVYRPSGTIFVITAKTGPSPFACTMLQMNNFENYAGTGWVDLSSSVPGSGSDVLVLIRTSTFYSNIVHFGDFTTGSAAVANVHDGTGDGSQVPTSCPAGMLLYCPGVFTQPINGAAIFEPIAGENPVVTNTYIATSTAGSPGSITLTIPSQRTGRYPIMPFAINHPKFL